MSEKDKKRLTLTGKNMPDPIFTKLEQLGNDRRLTPYIISLVEKEELMDTLISSLSILLDKVDNLDVQLQEINKKFTTINIPTSDDKRKSYDEKPNFVESVKQGDLGISDEVDSEIDEPINTDYDF
jgi:hypothetical protein